jgi:iron complex transport system substrate-binding protein
MRIVSLLPSATDIVFTLGLEEHLVGRTHECDWPPEVESVPQVTRDVLATSTMSARDIHLAISDSVHSGSSIYALDTKALREAKPDVILTQELCSVCAVSYSQVSNAVRIAESDAMVVSLEPRTIEEILESMLTVGEVTGVDARATEVVDDLRDRMESIRRRVETSPQPRVAAIEWLDPLFSAGHWVPEQVELAGGEERVGKKGLPSSEVEWDAILRESPDFLVLMPCGHGIDRARSDFRLLSERPGWDGLAAVRSGQVWAVDGPAYFNRPGPRVVRGAEVLAGIFNGSFSFEETEAIRLL